MVIKFNNLYNRQISQNSQKFEHLILHQRLFSSQFLSISQNLLSRKLSILTILSMVIKFNNSFRFFSSGRGCVWGRGASTNPASRLAVSFLMKC